MKGFEQRRIQHRIEEKVPSCFFKKIFICYLAAPGLSYSIWDLVPCSEMEPGPLALEARSLSHWITRKSPTFSLIEVRKVSKKQYLHPLVSSRSGG